MHQQRSGGPREGTAAAHKIVATTSRKLDQQQGNPVASVRASIAAGTADLTAEQARDLTARIRDAAEELWSLLLQVHDRRGWAALGYTSWQTYVTAEFGMSERHSYRLLDQGRVIRGLEAAGVTDTRVSHREAQEFKDAFELGPTFGAAFTISRRLLGDFRRRLDALDRCSGEAVLPGYVRLAEQARDLENAAAEHRLHHERVVGAYLNAVEAGDPHRVAEILARAEADQRDVDRRLLAAVQAVSASTLGGAA